MKISSSAQAEFKFPDSGIAPGEGAVPTDSSTVSHGAGSETAGTSPVAITVPNFGAYADIYAVTSRIAGRLNAASVSEDEYQRLLRERQRLLDKKLTNTISRKESNRLEYVRWSLDRIEDARYGESLDALESLVARYEAFSDELKNLELQLQAVKKKKK